jgi:RNA polymerase primary sigma factor
MYLQEMGGVPLLTREEEVAIAKEIETGEREVREGVFSLDLAVQYVLTWRAPAPREIEARHTRRRRGHRDRGGRRGRRDEGRQARRRVPEAGEQAQALRGEREKSRGARAAKT